MTDARTRRQLAAVLAVLTVAGAGLGVAGYLRGAPPADAGRFYLCNDGGAVHFDHTGHGQAAGGCVACHHELAGSALPCGDCHEDPDYSPAAVDHDELLANHDRACADCHEIAPANEATSCRECHAGELADIYHRSCQACHLATAPLRFAGEAGEPPCRNCHLR